MSPDAVGPAPRVGPRCVNKVGRRADGAVWSGEEGARQGGSLGLRLLMGWGRGKGVLLPDLPAGTRLVLVHNP